MSAQRHRGERLQIMLAAEELTLVDDFRFKNRMPSRAAAVRELFKRGLAALGYEMAEQGVRSSEFGVIDLKPSAARKTGGTGQSRV
jgi:hypothetical protein